MVAAAAGRRLARKIIQRMFKICDVSRNLLVRAGHGDGGGGGGGGGGPERRLAIRHSPAASKIKSATTLACLAQGAGRRGGGGGGGCGAGPPLGVQAQLGGRAIPRPAQGPHGHAVGLPAALRPVREPALRQKVISGNVQWPAPCKLAMISGGHALWGRRKRRRPHQKQTHVPATRPIELSSWILDSIDSPSKHSRRCIKPNPWGMPGRWDSAMALEQLRAGGVLEAVRIACAGVSADTPEPDTPSRSLL